MTVHSAADMAPEERAELYLCLAKAFSAHKHPLDVGQLRSALLPDFRQLAESLPALTETWLQDFARALEQTDQADSVMREHARLFLTPPAPASLNLGHYLDGSGQGATGQTLDRCYHRYGLVLSRDFHDLPDHLALNLQWIAWVFASIAETQAETPGTEESENSLRDLGWVLSHITLPACNQLLEKVQNAVQDFGFSPVWPMLVALAVEQLTDDVKRLRALVSAATERTPAAEPFNEWSDADRMETIAAKSSEADSLPPSAELQTMTCRTCGSDFVADEALSTMVQKLRAVGLTTDHMEVCPDCQTEQPVPGTMTPPGAKRFQPRH